MLTDRKRKLIKEHNHRWLNNIFLIRSTHTYKFGWGALWSSVSPALHGLPLSSVMVCLSLAGVSKAVENINKLIAPALVNKVGPFIVWLTLLYGSAKSLKLLVCSLNSSVIFLKICIKKGLHKNTCNIRSNTDCWQMTNCMVLKQSSKTLHKTVKQFVFSSLNSLHLPRFLTFALINSDMYTVALCI